MVGLFGSSHVERIQKLLHDSSTLETEVLNDLTSGKSISQVIGSTSSIRKKLKAFSRMYVVYVRFDWKIIYLYLLARLNGVELISHWIGSDVLNAQKFRFRFWIIKSLFTKNYVGSDLLQNELKELNCEAEKLYIVLDDIPLDIAEMPAQHAALIYMPEGKEEFYGLSLLKETVEKYPELNFYFVGNSKTELIPFSNAHFLGKISKEEMAELYNKISFLIRMPEHDGLSLMLLEAFAKGKQVVYRHDFPHVYTAKNSSELILAIERILGSNPVVKKETVEYFQSNYAASNYLESLKAILE